MVYLNILTLLHNNLINNDFKYMFNMILPTLSEELVNLANYRICSSALIGKNKQKQLSWLCLSCNVATCFACAVECHSKCKGSFDITVINCKCNERKCRCLSPTPNQQSDSVAKFVFGDNPELLPSPEDKTPWQYTLRYYNKLLKALINND